MVVPVVCSTAVMVLLAVVVKDGGFDAAPFSMVFLYRRLGAEQV